MPTLVEYNDINQNVELCKHLGTNFIELNLNLPYCLPENLPADKLLEISNKHNIFFTIHFPEEIDFASPFSSIREANLLLFQDIYHWATSFQAHLINIHLRSGVYFTLPDRKVWINDTCVEKTLKDFQKSMNSISNSVKSNFIKISFENESTNTYVSNAFKTLLKFNNINFTWDVGHDASSGFALKSFFEEHSDRVAHMHIHDFIDSRNHKELFTGNLDVPYYFNFAKENNATIVIETKTSKTLKSSLDKIKDI